MSSNEEYVNLLEGSGIFSYSLVKGTFILPPNGFILWQNIREYLDKRFAELKVKNVILPTLIPFSSFEKEREHVDGFSPELFSVEKRFFDEKISPKRREKSSELLVLRPTSEVLFYE